METKKKVIEIKDLIRLRNSYYGNPAWRVGFVVDGVFLYGRTATNSVAGYCLGYSDEGKKFKAEYHYTKAGNIIINRLTRIEEE